jgi:signal transduction histidine kinase
MRALGLRASILLLLLVPLALFAPLTVVVIHRGVSGEVAREVEQRASVLVRQAAVAVIDDILTGERLAAERKLADLGSERDVAYVFVVDPSGRLLAHTFPGGFPAQLLGVTRARRGQGEPVRVRLGAALVHDVTAPLLGGLGGTVHLGVGSAAARRTSLTVLLRLTAIGLSIVAAGVALALLLARRLVRRIDALTAAARTVGAGVLEVRVTDARDDELGRLGAAFNEMACRLGQARRDQELMFERLARSEKLVAVGQLAAGVAHEINNPLSGSLHCLENLGRVDHDAGRRREYYELMADGISRAQKVVRNLLEFARQHPPDIRPVDLNALTEKSLALVRAPFEQGHVRAVLSFDLGLPHVAADAHQIGQVVMNLLLNALEAMPGGGLCEVETTRCGDECRLRVRDSGHGIGPEVRGRIFDPFFTTKSDGRGSGLGLSVSLGIVERHGGRIEVTSAPGEGASFDVFLPVEQAARGTGEETAA